MNCEDCALVPPRAGSWLLAGFYCFRVEMGGVEKGFEGDG